MKSAKEIWHIVLRFFNNLKAWFVSIEVHNQSMTVETLIIINDVLMDGIEHGGSQHAKQAVQRIAELRDVEPEIHDLLVKKGFAK
ncbi:MAG TPA: hypothetical protein VMW24_23370 [Sedimentisphaerales bacterium]|nr:hypothetical protein [Sedimentisphaerales bacterium]